MAKKLFLTFALCYLSLSSAQGLYVGAGSSLFFGVAKPIKAVFSLQAGGAVSDYLGIRFMADTDLDGILISGEVIRNFNLYQLQNYSSDAYMGIGPSIMVPPLHGFTNAEVGFHGTLGVRQYAVPFEFYIELQPLFFASHGFAVNIRGGTNFPF